MSVFGAFKRYSVILSTLLLVPLIFLPGCGGGGGGKSTTSSTLGSATNIAELGLIENADIEISTIEGDLLYEETTNSGGEYILDKDKLEAEAKKHSYDVTFLQITSTGGVDTDPDDDGNIVEDEKKDVNGLVKGIISYSDLIDNDGVRTNLITTAIADTIFESEIEISDDSLNKVANELGIEDTNSDGVINNKDSFVYDVVKDDSEVEGKLRSNGYLDSIHDGDETTRTEIVQAMESSMEPVTFQQTENNSSSSITLKPLNSKNFILYQVNRDANETLTENYSHSIYNDENVIVEQGQTLYVQECKDIENCYEEQVLYNGGGSLQTNISVDSDTEAYSEPVEVANLRTELEAEIVKNDGLDSVETLESELDQLKNERAEKVVEYDENLESINMLLGFETDLSEWYIVNTNLLYNKDVLIASTNWNPYDATMYRLSDALDREKNPFKIAVILLATNIHHIQNPGIVAKNIEKRIKDAAKIGWITFKDEIYNSAKKGQASIVLYLDADYGSIEEATHFYKASYRISIGVLKAIFNTAGALMYGVAKDEIDYILYSIVEYTEDKFNDLAVDAQKQVLNDIDKAVLLINSNEELKAGIETAGYASLGKLAGAFRRILKGKLSVKLGKFETIKVGKVETFGSWPRSNVEVNKDLVIKQLDQVSCGQACGAMMLRDRGVNVKPVEIGEGLSSFQVNVPGNLLSQIVNIAPNIKWSSGHAIYFEKALNVLLRKGSGSWIAEMRGSVVNHAVVVNGVDINGFMKILDPWDSTTYTMTRSEFMKYWTGGFIGQ